MAPLRLLLAASLALGMGTLVAPAAQVVSDSTAGVSSPAQEQADPSVAEAPVAESSAAGTGGGQDDSPALPVSSFATAPGFTGAVAGSVNLFTGDVALPLPLVSLPGRGGLGAAVSASYSSNTEDAVATWNLDAPTGPMGLGWSLSVDRIVVDTKNTGATADDDYYYGSARLVEQDPGTSYRLFRVISQPDWEFRYAASTETWTVVTDTGVTMEYGNSGSNRATVDWGIRWGGFLGPAYAASGRTRYATAWNLSKITNLAGEAVTYSYLSDLELLGTGSQAHGTETYTRASYLQRIVTPDGQSAELVYGLKCDGNSTVSAGEDCQGTASRAEFMDPHTEANEPDAYQERYETRFLQRVDAKSAAGQVLFSVDLGYDFTGVGNLAKRRLTSVTHRAPSGETLPPLRFSYTSSSTTPSALSTVTMSEGATATFTYSTTDVLPGRGSLELTVPRPAGYGGEPRVWNGRDYVVIGWHKVVAGDNNDQVRIDAYRWNGEWVGGPVITGLIAERKEYCLSGGFLGACNLTRDSQNYEVFTADDHFTVLTYSLKPRELSGSRTSYAYSFHTDPSDPSAWVASGLRSIENAKNTDKGNADVNVVTGEQFVALASRSVGSLVVSAWTGTAWSSSFPSGYRDANDNDLHIAGQGNYLIVHQAYKTGRSDVAYLHTLNGRRTWTRGAQFLPSGFDVRSTGAVRWAAGDTYAMAAGNFTESASNSNSEMIFWWDDAYAVTRSYVSGYSDRTDVTPVPAGNLAVTSVYNQFTMNHRNGPLASVSNAIYVSDRVRMGPDFALATSSNGPLVIHEYNPNGMSFKTSSVSGSTVSSVRATPGYGYFVHNPLSGSSTTNPFSVAVRQPNGSWVPTSVTPGVLPTFFSTSPRFLVLHDRAFGTYSGRTRVYHLRNGALLSASTNYNTSIVDGSLQGGAIQAVGPFSYTTYCTGSGCTGGTITNASSITLHRVVGQRSTGTRPDRPVVALSVNDGFQTTVQSYRYTAATATYDASGTVAQYNEVETYAGTTSATSRPYGSTKTYFFNGLAGVDLPGLPAAASHTNAPAYARALAGATYRTVALDNAGTLVSNETTSYFVYRPAMARATAVFARPTRVVSARDGVTTTADRSYNTTNGYLAQETSTVRVPTPTGYADHTTKTRYKYFRQAYANGPAGLASPVVEVEEIVNGARARVAVSTWRDWGSGRWAPERSYVWTGTVAPLPPADAPPPPNALSESLVAGANVEALVPEMALAPEIPIPCDSEDPNCEPSWTPTPTPTPTPPSYTVSYPYSPVFSWWASTPPAVEWLQSSRVVSRTPWGAPRETESVDGVRASVVYDGSGYPLASFTNASVTEAALGADASWLDFESGSETSGIAANDYWGFYAQNDHVADAHSGRYSRRVGAGQFGPTRILHPTDQVGRYVVSAWVKTEPGFQPGKGTLAFSTQSTGGQEGYPNVPAGYGSVTFGDTRGEWTYLESVIDLATVRQQAGLAASTPLQFRVYLYNTDPSRSLLVDDVRFGPMMGSFQATTYDPSTRTAVAAHGINGSAAFTSYDTFSRPVEARDRRGRVMAESFGALSREKTGGAFSQALPNESVQRGYATANLVANGALELGRDAAGLPQRWSWPVNATVSIGAGYTGRGGLRVTATGNDGFVHNTFYDPGGLRPSTTYSVSFMARCEGGGACSTDAYLMRRSLSSGYVVFSPATVTVTGSAWKRYSTTVTTNSDARWDDGGLLPTLRLDVNEAGRTVTFDDIVVHEGNVLQAPSVSVTYADGAGKPRQSQAADGNAVVVTETLYDVAGRPVAQTQPGRFAGVFGWRAGFVADVDGRFGETNPDGTGNCAPSCGSLGPMAGEVATQNSLAQGYPYAQTRRERSPLGRPLESGLPGAGYQIGAGKTVWTVYGSNSNSNPFPGNLPANSFYITTTADPDGTTAKTLTDRAGRTVASEGVPLTLLSGATVRPVTWYDYDARGDLVRTRLPKYAQDSRFQLTTSYDFAGRPVSSMSPDAGTSRTVYDKAGRPRFTQHADAVAGSYVLYTRYDRVGRAVESGTITQAWDPAFLQSKANDLNWPDNTGAGWRLRSVYDADGAVRTWNQGRLLRAETNHDATVAAEAAETYTYDDRGRTVSVALTVSPHSPTARTVGYAYNDRGDVTTITYGAAPTADNQVAYAYDALGRVTKVGTPFDPSAYRIYTYNKDGQISTYELGIGNEGIYAYDPQGRLKMVEGTAFYETLTYTAGRGLVASAVYAYSGPAAGLNHLYTYTYDAAGQLTVANHSTRDALDIGVGTPTTYDEHGNITRLKRGATTTAYSYTAGTNRLASGPASYSYDGRGNATSAWNRGDFTYDSFLNLPTSYLFFSNATSAKYIYQGRRRVYKDVRSGFQRTLYVHGASDYPLYEEGTAGTVRYVYGPDGLIATVKDGVTRYVETDHLGSIRAVLSTSGAVVEAYTYGAYGETGDVYNGGTVYRYTGQELDAESGLLNYRARLYDPATGRFLSTDPQGQYSSPYVYAGNNPVMMVDPDGEFAFVPILAGIAISAAIGAGTSAAVYSATALVTGSKWSLRGLGTSAALGALGGAVSGGFSALATPLGSFGQSAAYSILSNTAGYAASAVATGTAFDPASLAGAVVGGFVAGGMPAYTPRAGTSPLSSIAQEVGYSAARGAAAGGVSGAVETGLRGGNLADIGGGLASGIGRGAVTGATVAGLQIAAMGYAYIPNDPTYAAGAAAMEADFSAVGLGAGPHLPVYRSGGGYAAFGSAVNYASRLLGLGAEIRPIAFGRNLLVWGGARGPDTYLHERVHYYQQIYQGYAPFLGRGAYEQVLNSFFGIPVYARPGYQEWAAEVISRQYLP